jgi:5-methyltetrahydrofolate--homocysteine methyltransferase
VLTHEIYGVEASKLFEDARLMLDRIDQERLFTPRGSAGFFPAMLTNEGDIALFIDPAKRELAGTVFSLRQQIDGPGNPPLRGLADFIAPAGDYLGMFAVTSGREVDVAARSFSMKGDDYSSVLLRLLSDRLAEAAAEYLHELVRKELWGYAPEESLPPVDLFKCNYRGIRPAPGYPACPDHTGKRLIFKLLEVEDTLGVTLTDSCAMNPPASVCGYYFSHPQSHYFSIGRIGTDQLESYARRTATSLDETKYRLSSLLGLVQR